MAVCGSGTADEPQPSAAVEVAPPITAIAFAPDGQTVLVGSQRGVTQHAWPNMQFLRELPCELGNIQALVFSPDGGKLAIAGGEPGERGIVQVLAWPDCVGLRRFTGHNDCVTDVDWTDPATLVSGSLDRQIMLWDMNSGTRKSTLAGHSKGVTSVCALQGACDFVSASMDETLRVWTCETGVPVRSLNNHTQTVHALSRRPGDFPSAMVASASDDRTIRIWQPTLGRMVRFARLPAVPLDVAWLSDGSRIVAACDDGRVRWMDPESASITQEVAALEGWIYCIAVHPSDGGLVVGGSDGRYFTIPSRSK